jgi:PrcB C-terminal
MAACVSRCGSRRTSSPRLRTARRCTCISVAALVITGCGSEAKPFPYEDLTPKLGALEFTHITVNRANSRQELLETLQRNNPGRKVRLPPIDFARQETFLVAAGPRSSTGYALRIVRVEDRGDDIRVVIREQTPSLDDRVRARVTYPYRLLLFDSDKPVKLKWLGRP